MEKEELENAIKEYLTQHISISILCDQDVDGHLKVGVGLWLDNMDKLKKLCNEF